MEKKKHKSIYDALYVEPIPEPEFGPSMVEPCHNLSIADILADYSRGIAHSTRETFYDDGDDIPDDIEDIEDIVDLQVNRVSAPDSRRSLEDGVTDPSDAGKPSGTKEEKRSGSDEGKEGPGAEA